MALITCPECSKRISETAERCPNCGFALTPQIVPAQKNKQGGGWLLVVSLAFLIVPSCIVFYVAF